MLSKRYTRSKKELRAKLEKHHTELAAVIDAQRKKAQNASDESKTEHGRSDRGRRSRRKTFGMEASQLIDVGREWRRYRFPNRACLPFSGVIRGVQADVVADYSPIRRHNRAGGFITFDSEIGEVLLKAFARADTLYTLPPSFNPDAEPQELINTTLAYAAVAVRFTLPIAPCVGIMSWGYDIDAQGSFEISRGRGRIWYLPQFIAPGENAPPLSVNDDSIDLLFATQSRPDAYSGWLSERGSFLMQRGESGTIRVAVSSIGSQTDRRVTSRLWS